MRALEQRYVQMPGARLTIMQAYRADHVAHPERADVEEANFWIILGHLLHRLGFATSEERREVRTRFSESLRSWAADPESADGFEGAAELAGLLDSANDRAGADRVFEWCLRVAERILRAGLDWTADELLHSLREAFPQASDALHARAIAQQAEIAERLGFPVDASHLRLESEIVAGLEGPARTNSIRGG